MCPGVCRTVGATVSVNGEKIQSKAFALTITRGSLFCFLFSFSILSSLHNVDYFCYAPVHMRLFHLLG